MRYFSHNTRSRQNETLLLINRAALPCSVYGENIASSPLGTIRSLSVGAYRNPHDARARRFRYRANNGRQLANDINNASMNHDAGDRNGHRANILDRQFSQIGVGVAYRQRNQNFYVAIEFVG